MSQSSTLFLGMDVHKATIAVAYVAQEHGAAVTSLGTMGTRQWAIDPLVRQMQSQANHLIVVYAAGPCGSWLSRYLTTKGSDGWGVAPSLMPQNPGDRGKTNRRDAVQLARLARSGALPLVAVPKVAAEAIRALTRARADTISDRKEATFRRTACLLRQDSRDAGRANGGPAPLRWLSDVVCPTAAPHSVLQEYVRAIPESTARLQRLAQARHAQVQGWRLHPVVEARQALRGVQWTVAVTMVAAIGDLPRFEHPRARLQCLGLMPSEYATGHQRRQGAMTQAGNTHARRALSEGAWASRYPAQVRRHRPLRLDKQPKVIQDLSWQAQVRLCRR